MYVIIAILVNWIKVSFVQTCNVLSDTLWSGRDPYRANLDETRHIHENFPNYAREIEEYSFCPVCHSEIL